MRVDMLTVLVFVCIAEFVRCTLYGADVAQYTTEFRYDYKYFDEVEGWFKLHRIGRTFKEAQRRCILEGADLASPTSGEMVRAMAAALTSSPPWDGVYIGVHATFATGEYQYNGVPLERMPVEWIPSGPLSIDARDCIVFLHNTSITNENCKRDLPFLCFKKRTEDFLLNSCGTVDNDYKFESKTGSCYKLHTNGQNWSTAVKYCAAEGAYLAVVNSANEMRILQSIFRSSPPDLINAAYKDSLHLGFTDLDKTREWTTVLGKSLVDTYESWDTNEPNNANDGEYCGNLKAAGKMNDAGCKYILSFICEKHPKSLLSSIP